MPATTRARTSPTSRVESRVNSVKETPDSLSVYAPSRKSTCRWGVGSPNELESGKVVGPKIAQAT
jgi:hypothetical protein